ncbi:MAG: hypothetical protein DRR15_11040 [Gammaproteobacteria bacterium]|nr:MAG: hypothetical protein DRR15_11040 [Gammaproteobacteria bacterium]
MTGIAENDLSLPRFEWDPVNIAEFYSKAETSAGRALPVPELNLVLCSRRALEQLPGVIDKLDARGIADVLIVQDNTPMQRSNVNLKHLVKRQLQATGRNVSTLTLEGAEGQNLTTSQVKIDQVRQAIQSNPVVIALGSGCITDIAKHACFETGQMQDEVIPLIAIQTANSVCAFTSRMTVLTINGVKRTVPSRMANVLIMDTQILKDAPPIYRTGGLGDVAVAAVTFADLHLAASLGMGKWNQLAYETSSDIRNILLGQHASIADGGIIGQEVAGKLMALAGLALTLCGDSAPLSGYEHMTSHMLDMAAKSNGRAVANHGHQCALATVLSLLLYRHIIEKLDAGAININTCYPDEKTMRRKIDTVFKQIDTSGAAAAECASDYMQKLEKWRLARPLFETFLSNWEQEKTRLQKHLMSPEQFIDLLCKIGHPLRFEELEVPLGRDEVRWAFKNAHLMRKRFAIGDLAFLGGFFDETLCDQIFEEFDHLTNAIIKHGGKLD